MSKNCQARLHAKLISTAVFFNEKGWIYYEYEIIINYTHKTAESPRYMKQTQSWREKQTFLWLYLKASIPGFQYWIKRLYRQSMRKWKINSGLSSVFGLKFYTQGEGLVCLSWVSAPSTIPSLRGEYESNWQTDMASFLRELIQCLSFLWKTNERI